MVVAGSIVARFLAERYARGHLRKPKEAVRIAPMQRGLGWSALKDLLGEGAEAFGAPNDLLEIWAAKRLAPY